MMEFKNREYYEEIRQTYYSLQKWAPDRLELLGVKDKGIPGFVEEMAVHGVAQLRKELPDFINKDINYGLNQIFQRSSRRPTQ